MKNNGKMFRKENSMIRFSKSLESKLQTAQLCHMSDDHLVVTEIRSQEEKVKAERGTSQFLHDTASHFVSSSL